MHPSVQTWLSLLTGIQTVGWESLIALSASKVALEPGAHAVEHRFGVPAQGVPAMRGPNVVTRVEQQPHAGGENRVAHHVGKTLHGLRDAQAHRSEEHTSELQSQSNLVCRLLLEKKKKKRKHRTYR